MRKKGFLLIVCAALLAGCNYKNPDDRTGFFYNTFVSPLDHLLHGLGSLFGGNYGFAIICIVLFVRIILMPFMVMQTKNLHMMREKTNIVKPQINQIKDRMKHAENHEEKNEARQALVETYQQYGISPWKSMLGCLPVLIQIPLLFALIAVLKYPSKGGINDHPHFLWFNLTEPEIFITIIAAIIYFIQPIANLIHYPKGQRTPYYIMMVSSPIVITFVALHSASALGLYWTFSGLFLIVQNHLSHKVYKRKAQTEAQQLASKHETT
ncbi:membrane protein insertase YidC [Staphylococcus sp. SQ8-PEA]|uniref:Membrane protein insertase YidC n=1 Tax=Staphylococcus marylandisciuri TaxID=2981529 RepID=A0ABT2QMW6_9STAP|nr:membrane protein insertase YidC [Staphylococcus marylandisciuri]MCU5745299.1 membrane protein insertase YidC [Staphylococcus marylandisciuri]